MLEFIETSGKINKERFIETKKIRKKKKTGTNEYYIKRDLKAWTQVKNGRIHTSGKNNAHNNYKTNPTLCDQGNNYKIITIKKEGINKKKM